MSRGNVVVAVFVVLILAVTAAAVLAATGDGRSRVFNFHDPTL